MKFLRKWLKPDPKQQSAVNEAKQAPASVSVRSEEESEGEHSDESSVSWLGIDQADSSIFDTGKLVNEKSEDKDAVPHSTLRLEDDPPPGAKEDIGVDPYNTGRFDTENK